MELLVFISVLTQVTLMSQCKKFVVLLGQSKSHVFPVIPIARELQRLNHSVTFVLSPGMAEDIGNIGVTQLTSSSLDPTQYLDNMIEVFSAKTTTDKLVSYYRLLKSIQSMCNNVLEDNDLYLKLKKQEFDYAIVGYAPILCLEVMAYKLSLPFVFIGAHIDLKAYRVPFYPSFMPTFLSGFSDRMTFAQRIANTISFIMKLVIPTVPSFEQLVDKFAPERPFLTNSQLKRSALLHIVDSDVLMEFPLPIPPNMILCGGLAAKKAQPLPLYLEEFANTSSALIIVSFGSIQKTMPEKLLSKLIDTFKRMKQLRFVVRYGNVQTIVENVLLLPWLPQNDLLGHPKIKLFITHCGKSGIFEALYHGIPMIGFPLGLDQTANAAVITNKGYGVAMDYTDFSVEELQENIEKVAFTNIYKDKISVASKIFHSRPQTPPERAAYWIDLVTKYGSEQFRSSFMDMPWYTYYMLDIGLFFLVLFAALLFVLQLLCRCLFKCCKRSNKKPKSE